LSLLLILRSHHKVAGLNYGTVDVECDAAYKNNLLKVTQEGRVKKKSLVAAVTRIFKGRFQVHFMIVSPRCYYST